MTVTKMVTALTFEFWSGGADTVADLTLEELEEVWERVEEMYSTVEEPPTETDINDFFWFERDTIANWLGYNDYDELMKDRY